MSFSEERLCDGYICYNTEGGPEYSTDVVVLNSGREQRNRNWQYARGAWNFGDRKLPDTELYEIIKFFRARGGKAEGFRMQDWADYQVLATEGILAIPGTNLGNGNGTATIFQMQKAYANGLETDYRIIAKPVTGKCTFYKNGVLLVTGTDVTIDYTTGLVTFAVAPTIGAILTWAGQFDVPVRFDTDTLKSRFDSAEVIVPGTLGTKYFYLSQLPLVEIPV